MSQQERTAPPPSSMQDVRRRKHKKKRRGVPAPIVFYAAAVLALVAAAGTHVLGGWLVALSAVACGLIIVVLYLNDEKGFLKSKKMRRAYAPRSHFTSLEVFVLCALLLLNLFVTAFALVA